MNEAELAKLTRDISGKASISLNTDIHFITITKDKLELSLMKHKNIIEASNSWIGYLFAFAGFAISIYLSYKQFNEIIKVISIVLSAFMAFFCVKNFIIFFQNKNKGIDFLIKCIQEDSDTLTNNVAKQDMNNGVI